ncbi:hypothetical protein OOK58_02630 [Streptomyces sp. NBC_01728]|uniref:hypothetical protein n=1 Tax=unclassified Streptomyces TaxID=2593676 RepID=UPI00225311E7|nr:MULTISPECIES: hypothetical protein [unclassified Streptomyces]MCX4461572.1 hypothetical protein [Streptomyces sp. NBC_01719]MCX4490479.1 hypothetical protein [Streptomyces sp. NBC_01728]MCX4597270.1 hypothetical protein [Streptomyces sp. NBC_01549]
MNADVGYRVGGGQVRFGQHLGVLNVEAAVRDDQGLHATPPLGLDHECVDGFGERLQPLFDLKVYEAVDEGLLVWAGKVTGSIEECPVPVGEDEGADVGLADLVAQQPGGVRRPPQVCQQVVVSG